MLCMQYTAITAIYFILNAPNENLKPVLWNMYQMSLELRITYQEFQNIFMMYMLVHETFFFFAIEKELKPKRGGDWQQKRSTLDLSFKYAIHARSELENWLAVFLLIYFECCALNMNDFCDV